MGKGTQKVTNTTTPPPEVMQFYRNLTGRATGVANTPFKPYTGQIAAGSSPLQTQANAGYANMGNVWQPYFDRAQQYATPQQFSQGALSKYLDPFHSQVIDATMANMNQDNARQQQSVIGNSILHGAWGGDRSAIAQSELARQQKLADDQTLANLNSQNYTQALGQFNTDNNLNQNAATQFANLGNAAQGNMLNQLQATESAGNQQQATQQNQLNAAYQQFQNEQAYPFQTTQFLAGVGGGAAGGMGGTSTQTSPAPNMLSQILGTGLGLFGAFGAKDGGAINAPQPYADGGAVHGYATGGGPLVPFDPTQALIPYRGAESILHPGQTLADNLYPDDPRLGMHGATLGYDLSGHEKLGVPFAAPDTTGSTATPAGPMSFADVLGGGGDTSGIGDLPIGDAIHDPYAGLTPKQLRRRDMATMGWAMAAGNSPYFLQNVGAGGMEAQKSKKERMAFEADLAYKNAAIATQQRAANTAARQLGFELAGGNETVQFNRANDYRLQHGLPPLSPEEYMTEKARAGAATTTYQAESTASTEGTKILLKPIGDVIEGGQGARDELRALNTMNQMLPSIYTGTGGQEVLEVKRALQSIGQVFGIGDEGDAEAIANSQGIAKMEAFQKFARKLAAAQAKANVGSRVTNFELDTFIQNNPSLMLSPAGNQMLLSIMIQDASLRAAVSDIAQKDLAAVTGGTLKKDGSKMTMGDIYNDMHEYAAAHPIKLNGMDLTTDTIVPGFGGDKASTTTPTPAATTSVSAPTSYPPNHVYQKGDRVSDGKGGIFDYSGYGDPADMKNWTPVRP